MNDANLASGSNLISTSSKRMTLRTDSRDSSCTFAPMRPFDEQCVETPANQLPDNFDFTTFRKYARSDETEKRESAARKSAIAINRIKDGEEDYKEYIALLEELLSDTDNVQVAALEQMKDVFSELRRSPVLFEQANSRLPTLITQSLDFSTKVQTGAIDTLTNLLDENLLMQDVLLSVVVPSLFEYVIDQSNCSWKGGDHEMVPERWFVSRVNIIAILSNIASRSIFNYPKEWVFEQFVPRFSFFFTDKNPVVRKLSIQAVGSFAKLFGLSFTEKCLVPHLHRAIYDESFRVRKLCCDVFVDVAKNCSGKVKAEMLTPLFLHLLRDSDKTVYHTAIRQLGAFIATFADPNKTGIEFKDGRLVQLDSLSHNEEGEEDDEDIDLRTQDMDTGKLSSFDSTHDLTAVLSNGHIPAAHSPPGEPAPEEQLDVEGDSQEEKYKSIPKGFVLPAEDMSNWEKQQEELEDEGLDGPCLLNKTIDPMRATIASEARDHEANVNGMKAWLQARNFNKAASSNEENDVGQQRNAFESYTRFSFESHSGEQGVDEQNVDEVKNFRKQQETSPEEQQQQRLALRKQLEERLNLNFYARNIEQEELQQQSTADEMPVSSNSSEVTQGNLEKLDELRSEVFLPRNDSNMSTAATLGSDTDLESCPTSSSQAQSDSSFDELTSPTTYWSFEARPSLLELEMQANELEAYNSRRSQQLRLRNGQDTTATDACGDKVSTVEPTGCQESTERENQDEVLLKDGETSSSQLSNLKLAYSQIEAEIVAGQTQTPQFSAMESGSSSYWQKRLDILHRSVQSVVHNGSGVLAALPVSLRRLTISESSSTSSSNDMANNNSFSPTSSANHFSESNGNKATSQSSQQSHEGFEKQTHLNTVSEDDDKDFDDTPDFNNLNAFSRGDMFSNSMLKSKSIKSNNRFIVSRRILSDGSFVDSSGSLPSVPPLCLDDRGNGDEQVSRLRRPESQYRARNNRMEEEDSGRGTLEIEKQQVSPSSSNHDGESSANSSRSRLHDEVVRLSSIDQYRCFLTSEEQEFLANSEQDVIPQQLLELLDGLVSLDFKENQRIKEEQVDIYRHIAHSIPAIVYTFGSSKWIFVKGLYMSLAYNYQTEVRETIAASLHEVAAIIGSDNTDRDLLPLFHRFMKDTLTVQYGLLRHLYDFCKVVSPQCRQIFAQRLNQFVTIDGGKYRARADFAEQLVLLVRLFNAPQVNHYISAFALTFATDRIAEVRNSGVEVLAEVLSLFIREEWSDHAAKSSDNFTVNSEDLPLTDRLLSEIRVGFSQSRNWRRRQSFGRMLEIIIRKELITNDQFLHLFYNDLIQISKDAVSNVRQHFCKLCQFISSADFFGSYDRSVSMAIKCRLQELVEQDPDLEINIQAKIAIDPETAEIAEKDLKCREHTLNEASEAIYRRFRARKSTSEQKDVSLSLQSTASKVTPPRGQPPIAQAEVMEELFLEENNLPPCSTTTDTVKRGDDDDLLFE